MNNRNRDNAYPVYTQIKSLLKELDQVIEKHVQIIISQMESGSQENREEG